MLHKCFTYIPLDQKHYSSYPEVKYIGFIFFLFLSSFLIHFFISFLSKRMQTENKGKKAEKMLWKSIFNWSWEKGIMFDFSFAKKENKNTFRTFSWKPFSLAESTLLSTRQRSPLIAKSTPLSEVFNIWSLMTLVCVSLIFLRHLCSSSSRLKSKLGNWEKN